MCKQFEGDYILMNGVVFVAFHCAGGLVVSEGIMHLTRVLCTAGKEALCLHAEFVNAKCITDIACLRRTAGSFCFYIFANSVDSSLLYSKRK